MKISIQSAERAIKQALLKLGYDAGEASAICDVLMYAQLRGSSRGIAELLSTGTVKKQQSLRIVMQKETMASAFMDAHGAHAMLAISQAVEVAAQKATKAGIAVVTIHNTSAASGALGYYPYKLALQGFVGIVMATTPPMVAPAGSYQPIFGANPLAIAVPTAKDPLVLDMDTAALAFPGVRALAAAGTSLPEGIAYDKNGNLTNDPAAALEGAMRPFDKGYKGSHLALMVQILAGPLTGSGERADDLRGHFIIAIDPDVLCGVDVVRAQVTDIMHTVKSAKIVSGSTEVVLPGEREERRRQEAIRTGEINLSQTLYHDLMKLAA